MQPQIAQLVQMAQKIKQSQQQVDPSVTALVQTQMAETQRRAAKDQGDLQLKAQDMQVRNQEFQQKIQADIVKNTENNLTDERIKSAELTRDAAQLQHEQLQTVIDAQNQIQTNLGGQPNV